MSKLTPKYTYWEGLNIAIELAMQCIDEVRALARLPGPAGKDGTDGKDGANGKDGADGIVFDDIDEQYEDEGRIQVRTYLRQGQIFKQFRHITKSSIFRGIHDSSRTYLPGDEVTRGGSQWHCKAECSGPFNGDFWILNVKKGTDR